MSKEQLGARVDPDGSLYQEFEQFEKSGGFESRSEAIRAVMRAGLDGKNTGPLDDRPESALAGLLWDARRDIHTFVLIVLVSIGLSVLTSGIASMVFLGIAGLYSLTVSVGVVDALVLNNRLTLRLMDISDRVTVEVKA